MSTQATEQAGKGRGILLFLLPSRSPVRVVLVGGVVARSGLGVVLDRQALSCTTRVASNRVKGGRARPKGIASLFLCRPAGKGKPSARIPAGLDGKRQQQTCFAGTLGPKAKMLPGRIMPTREGHTPKEQQHTHR